MGPQSIRRAFRSGILQLVVRILKPPVFYISHLEETWTPLLNQIMWNSKRWLQMPTPQASRAFHLISILTFRRPLLRLLAREYSNCCCVKSYGHNESPVIGRHIEIAEVHQYVIGMVGSNLTCLRGTIQY